VLAAFAETVRHGANQTSAWCWASPTQAVAAKLSAGAEMNRKEYECYYRGYCPDGHWGDANDNHRSQNADRGDHNWGGSKLGRPD
jgi:hypothetical protein